MNEDNRSDSGPYEFEREVRSSARMRAIWITTAAIVVTGGLVAGAAFALGNKTEKEESRPNSGQVGTAPSYSNESVEPGEQTNEPDQHTVVVPPVSVKPKHKPSVPASPAPGFTKKPHFGHGDENDDEHEGSDD
jgi:hypothetical protein